MSQTRDLTSVLKGIDFLLRPTLAAGTITTKPVDLRAAITSSDLSEVVTRIFMMMSVEFGAAGTIDIEVEHSDDNTFGWTNLGTLAQATQAATFFTGEFGDLKRYVRLQVTVTGVVQTIAILATGAHGMRNPVVQTGTALAFTAA